MLRSTKIRAFLLVAIISLPILWIVDPLGVVSTDLNWAVESGDEFRYRISYTYRNLTWYDISKDIGIWLLPLNNTQVIFKITDLPFIPFIANSYGFADTVIEKNKSSVRFENDSLISADYSEILTLLFSRCLLPIGDWIFIDRLYPDSVFSSSLYDLSYSYLSYFEEADFFIGNIGTSHHGSGGWSGIVNMTTGVPETIRQYEEWHWGDGSSYSYELVLIQDA